MFKECETNDQMARNHTTDTNVLVSMSMLVLVTFLSVARHAERSESSRRVGDMFRPWPAATAILRATLTISIIV